MELIGVAFKIVPDETLMKVVKGKLDTNVPMKISTYDKNAIEEAVRIKEKLGGKVVGVTVGAEDSKSVRSALAMGLDEVIVVKTGYVDALTTAQIIAEEIGKSDIILTGESSTDGGDSAVPPMIGEVLGIPSVTYVRKLEIRADRTFTAERNLLSITEVVEGGLPAVISVTGEINTPRVPALRQIMESSKKPVRVKQLEVRARSSLEGLEAYTIPRKREILEGNLSNQVETIARVLRETL